MYRQTDYTKKHMDRHIDGQTERQAQTINNATKTNQEGNMLNGHSSIEPERNSGIQKK